MAFSFSNYLPRNPQQPQQPQNGFRFGDWLRSGTAMTPQPQMQPQTTQTPVAQPTDDELAFGLEMMRQGRSQGWDGSWNPPGVLSLTNAPAGPTGAATDDLGDWSDLADEIDEPSVQPVQQAPQQPVAQPASQPAAQSPQQPLFADPQPQQEAPEMRRSLTPGRAEDVSAKRIDPAWKAFNDKLNQLVNGGSSDEEVRAFIAANPQFTAGNIDEALAWRAKHPNVEIPVNLNTDAVDFGKDEGAGAAALYGTLDGALIGAADNIDSALGASLETLKFDGTTWGERYDRYQEKNLDAFDRAQHYHPNYFLGGQIAGGIASSLAVPESALLRGGANAVRAAKGVSAVTPEARTALGVMGRNVAEGAAYNGLYSFNSADDGSIGNRFSEGAKGAAVGAVIGVGTGMLGVGANRAAQRMKQIDINGAPMGQRVMEAAERLNSRYHGDIRPLPGHVSNSGLTATAHAAVEPTILGGYASGFGILPSLRGASKEFENSVERTVKEATEFAAQGPRKPLEYAIDNALDPSETGTLATFKQEAAARADTLYTEARSLAGKGFRLAVPRTLAKLDEILARYRKVPGGVAGIGELQELRASLARGTHDLQGLRDLRSTFGDRIDIQNSTVRGAAKQLWGELTADIQQGLRNAGKSDAARAFRKADKQFEDDMKSLATVEKLLGKGGDPSPARVMQRVSSMSTKDARELSRLLGKLDERVAGDIRGGLIDQMGLTQVGRMTNDTRFSLDTFATNWGKVGPDARKAMFNQTTIRDLDDLATLAMAERRMNQLGNRSRSGIFVENFREMGVIARGGKHLLDFGAAGLGLSVWPTVAGLPTLGRVLASPGVARVMVRMAKGGIRREAALSMLAEAARRDPAAAQGIMELRHRVEKATISTGPATQEQAQAPVEDWSDLADEIDPEALDMTETAEPTVNFIQGDDGQIYNAETGDVVEQ